MKHSVFHLLAISIVFTVAPPSYPASPDAGQLLREQEQVAPRQLERLPAPAPEVVRPALPDTGIKVRVRTIRFTGIEGLVSEAELQRLVAGATGRDLSFSELQELAGRVTQYLKDRGWFLARAYLPKQDVTNGVIEIAVLRGRVEGGADGRGIDIKAEAVRLEETRIRNTVSRAIAPDGGLKGADLERAILLLNDLPGVEARSTLERGTEPGTTRVSVSVVEGPLVTGNAWFDNYGNRYTGAARANAQMSLNDPSGSGDQASLAVTGADGLVYGRLGYSVPIGYTGLHATASYSALTYEIGKELANLRSEGSARTATASLSYPFARGRTFNLLGSTGYEYKALKDETLGLTTRDKRLNDWTLALNGDVFDNVGGGGLTNFAVGATFGDLDLARVAADLAADQATARTQGSFSKINYSLARLQRLSDRFTFFLIGNAQTASKNLDSSEKFMLGGPGGVRAYPVGEASGDEGWSATAELRYDVPSTLFGGRPQLVGFFDTGQITLSKTPWGPAPNSEGVNRYRLSGAGIGANLALTGRYALRAAWARKAGSNPGRTIQGNNADGRSDDDRFWLQALAWF